MSLIITGTAKFGGTRCWRPVIPVEFIEFAFDAYVYEDMDALVNAAAAHNVKLLPMLMVGLRLLVLISPASRPKR